MPAHALRLDMRRPGFSGCAVTIEQDENRRLRLAVDVDDDHYSGEVVLTDEQVEALVLLAVWANREKL